jgi:GAF domain-containing protein
MLTASRLFLGANAAAEDLLQLSASTLAYEPGQMCLISLAARSQADSLRPAAVAHVDPTAHAQLQRILLDARSLPADAFSRAAFRARSAVRMNIENRRVLRLWLPAPYWPYVERVGIASVMGLAIRARSRPVGTLLLWRQPGLPAFDRADQEYVACLAARLALAL